MGKSARQHQILVTVTFAAVLLGCVMCASPTTRPSPSPTTTPSPTPLATVDSQTYGALLYVDGRVVREGWGEATDWQITDLPFEQVLAATLENDSRLWMLADGRLAVVDLPSGTTEEVAEIESPTRWGELLMIEGRHSIAYTAGVDDNSTLLGYATCMGLYDIQTQQTRPLARLPGTLRLLGSSLQQGTLYAVQLGGDGGFGAILSIGTCILSCSPGH